MAIGGNKREERNNLKKEMKVGEHQDEKLRWLSEVKYLGQIIDEDLSDKKSIAVAISKGCTAQTT